MSEDAVIGHRHAWELIPWVLNGRATAEERALVEAHVRECADCRGELEFQRSVQQGILQTPVAESESAAALARLWQRIDAGTVESIAPKSAPLVRWLAVAVVVEAVGIAALSGSAVLSARNAPYQTLSSTAATPQRATLRAVFAPQTSQSELQSLLRHSGLQIVGGPSEAGAYALAADVPIDQALAALRADPRVLFAEPVQ